MDQQMALIIFIDILGIGIAVWFLATRLKAKLSEVEERKAKRWKRDEFLAAEVASDEEE
ncbi:MAG: hypothetical protein P8Q45_02885 [Candidatus Thalassarchaeaceae archaeon]|jgi:hypothetical protein|nr:hypothetical protein [Candidatus Thalassarchaeaceae archaeon]|tara:strand:- start:182 stop:358 length:177 start_codon:yes stop_codon:yes gene_type:complete